MTGPQEAGVREHQLRRQRAVLKKPLRAVEVGEDQFEQACPLDEAAFEMSGFGGRDEERDRIELPGAVHAARVAVDVVGDAVLADEVLGFVPAVAEF